MHAAIRWALGIGVAWTILYVIFWLDRSGCFAGFTKECNDAPIRGLGDFFMFDWVWHYQTIIGGLAALGAGGFVVIAARITAKGQRDSEHRRMREDARSACAVVAARFIDAAVCLQGKEVTDDDLDFSVTLVHLVTLARIDTMLAGVVQASIREVRKSLRLRKILTVDRHLLNGPFHSHEIALGNRKFAAQAYAMVQILHTVENRLDATGRYDLYRASNMRPGVLRNHLNYLGVGKESLGVLRSFFDWDNHEERAPR